MTTTRMGPAPGGRNGWYGLALAMLRDIEVRGLPQAAAVAAAAARTGRKASTLEHMLQVGRYVRDKRPEGDVLGTLSVFQVLRSAERKAPERVGELFRIALSGEVGRTGMQALVRAAAAGRPIAWPPPPRPSRGGASAAPRALDTAATLGAMAAWLAGIVRDGGAGLLVGVADRHSALSFSACARACASLGDPAAAAALCFGPEAAAWASAAHPGATVALADGTAARDEAGRWAELARRRGGNGGPRLVGARTATALWLGDAHDLARSASVEPLADLWHTEVDALCDGLGIPALGGGPARPAVDPRALDLALMVRAGTLARGHAAAAFDPADLAAADALAAGASAWSGSDAAVRFAAPVTA